MLKKTTNLNLGDLVKLLKLVGSLKTIPRSGWVDVGIQNAESVADHTFRTSILCMVYSGLNGLDELKLLRMSLIHDLPEAITGDLTPSKKTNRYRQKETDAMYQMLSLLPKELTEEILSVWNEYQKGKTKEAKAVRQLDKLEMALQAKEYEETGLLRQDLKKFAETAEQAITWPEYKDLLSYMLEE